MGAILHEEDDFYKCDSYYHFYLIMEKLAE